MTQESYGSTVTEFILREYARAEKLDIPGGKRGSRPDGLRQGTPSPGIHSSSWWLVWLHVGHRCLLRSCLDVTFLGD